MRVLIVNPTFPEPDTNAGGLRLFEIVQMLVQDGCEVTFLASGPNADRYRQGLKALGVSTVCDATDGLDGSTHQFRRLLRRGDFERAIFVHYHMYVRYAAYVRAFLPRCRLVLDTVDLHFVRCSREAELTDDPLQRRDAAEMRRVELGAIGEADHVWVTTEAEREYLRTEGIVGPIAVIPTIHNVHPHRHDYEARSGIVFLGGYRHRPNIDAVQFFMSQVVPVLRQSLPGVPITIAGSHPPKWFKDYERNPSQVFVPGFVADHHALLISSRVGIAPLRFGAGIKGKIGEYLSCGLPCVATPIAIEGMGLRHGTDVMVAENPIAFAGAIKRLYDDPQLWTRISQAGRDHVEHNFSAKAIAPRVTAAIRQADIPAPRRLDTRKQRRWVDLARHPHHVLHLGRKSVVALRSGGWSELSSRMAVWSMRSEAPRDGEVTK